MAPVRPRDHRLAAVLAGLLLAPALVLGLVLSACAPGDPAPEKLPAGSPLQLVESTPVETDLDHPDVPDAWEVWPEMIAGAEKSVDLAGFYVSNHPAGRLEPVLRALESAGRRGVRVRVLGEKGFYETYPGSLDRLAAADGVFVRLVDFRRLAGGAMHAKYFVVDADEAFVGSQNFDWRALEHIHETGLRIAIPAYARTLTWVFEMDWAAAKPLGEEDTTASAADLLTAEARAGDAGPYTWVEAGGDTARAWPALSPRGFLPDSTTWDLPRILALIDGARDSVQATVLTYRTHGRQGRVWTEIDDALRGAAARGVRVRLLVADWSKRKPAIEALQNLERTEGVQVRLVTIPEASTGFIPFARVTHAKYLTADGRDCWLGTSNWERSYFFTSRNVGIVVQGGDLAGGLDRDFLTLWNSRYAYPVDPDAEYEPPRIGP